jgi:hypothetical protein
VRRALFLTGNALAGLERGHNRRNTLPLEFAGRTILRRRAPPRRNAVGRGDGFLPFLSLFFIQGRL